MQQAQASGGAPSDSAADDWANLIVPQRRAGKLAAQRLTSGAAAPALLEASLPAAAVAAAARRAAADRVHGEDEFDEPGVKAGDCVVVFSMAAYAARERQRPV